MKDPSMCDRKVKFAGIELKVDPIDRPRTDDCSISIYGTSKQFGEADKNTVRKIIESSIYVSDPNKPSFREGEK